MTFEENILEIIVDQFRGRIVIALYLVADHLHLLINLRLGISAMKDNIGQHVNSLCQMLFQNSSIINRVFFHCKGIEITAHTLQGIQNLQGTAALRSLEGGVFHEMRQTFIARHFMASSRRYFITTIDHRRSGRQMDDTKSVRQSKSIVLHKNRGKITKNFKH